MKLTDREKEMLDGKDGEAVRIAMSILSDIGDAVEAEEMVEIVHVHTDSGFYLDENRKAEVLIKCGNLAANILADSAFYPILGYLAGHHAGNKVIAIEGIPKSVSVDNLKDLGAAAASSGSVALFHIIGVTPEAHSREMCLKEKNTPKSIMVTEGMIKIMEEKLWTTTEERLDWVGFGCPHFSISEFRELACLIEGNSVSKDVRVTVFTSRNIHMWVKRLGILKILNDAGIEVYTDGCLLLFPQNVGKTGIMMTNSAKAANYIYSQSGLKAAYGSIKDCVDSALAGKIIRRGSAWLW